MALVVVPSGGGAPRIVVPPQSPASAPGYMAAFSGDGRIIYYVARDPEQQKGGIWRVPSGGGPRSLAVSFDDRSSGVSRAWIRVHGNRLYFTLGDPQSDLWMTEVTGSH